MYKMDKTTKKNEKRWDQLVQSDVPCSRPRVELTQKTARKMLDPNGILGDLNGKNVLCLASGGGQQSVGFALLGANVAVVDFSAEQLEKDKEVARKLSLNIRIVKTDMQELSMFKDNEFDVVYQPYSINYIQGTSKLFDEVVRVTKLGGIYHLMFHNPFIHGSWKNGCWGSRWKTKDLWRGVGYPIKQEYKESLPIEVDDPYWDFPDSKGKEQRVKAPQEFKHTLSNIINGLTERGFSVLRLEEYTEGDINSEPGTWEHYVAVAVPWLFLWLKKN